MEFIKEENETAVLFLNDSNGYMSSDPGAFLVFVSDFAFDVVKSNERQQPGAGRTGGNWREALVSSNMSFRIIAKGKKSEFMQEPLLNCISCEYKVISGSANLLTKYALVSLRTKRIVAHALEKKVKRK